MITAWQSIPLLSARPQNINPIPSLLIPAFMLTALASTEMEELEGKAGTNALTFTGSQNTRSWNRGIVSNQLLSGLIDLQR